MRKVIRKRIRHKEEGLDLALDLNADVAINVGRSRPAPPADGGSTPKDGSSEDPARGDDNHQEGSTS
jgi:hypothetical protein